ncbi:hypothetical protein KKF59_00270 [Patescibacteria group bacterium]|nr:hypothetical protein [Patescibacteria group bacterium]MBU1034543.1 hypothetical protein [Patescibacteria group bacterium]MBU1629729.1 hypothetical protein [Patescibacteria group bacterium]MBU1907553.1 hypothetical protein [Patescibacteria group bacterium]
MKRLYPIFFAFFGVMLALPAVAANPLSWTDLSDKLAVRSNRTVWAMAYNNNLYYTDGLDLWNGGQVYRKEQHGVVNITSEVRSAGLSRVDDIVTDGQSVLFLKNPDLRNNQFEVLKYRSGIYTNVTSAWRSSFESNEGIGNISGRSGEWFIVTSLGKVLKWDGSSNAPTRLLLPWELSNNVNNTFQNFKSSANSGNYYLPYKNEVFRILPISGNKWLFVLSYDHNKIYNPYSTINKIYRLDSNNFSDITYEFKSDVAYRAVASNGTSALLVSSCTAYSSLASQYGKEYIEVTGYGLTKHVSPIELKGQAIWTGRSWMFLNVAEKRLTRVLEGAVEDLGKTRDYFVTMASNNNGQIFFGGAVSDIALSEPSLPLTAKLALASETAWTTNTVSSNATTAFNFSVWQNFEPEQSTLPSRSSVVYRVTGQYNRPTGAQDRTGFSKIEIYVNGRLVKMCLPQAVSDTESCAYIIEGAGYPLESQVAVNARVVGSVGEYQQVWTPLRFLQVTDSVTASYLNSAPKTWAWRTPGHQSAVTQTATYNVGAWDGDNGIAYVEIWVNGRVAKICNFASYKYNVECTLNLNAGDYAYGSEVYTNAKVVDAANNVSWAEGMRWQVQKNGLATPPYPAESVQSTTFDYAGTVSVQANTAGYVNNQYITFSAAAEDSNGVARIEFYINGAYAYSCFNSTSCSWTTNAYSNQSYFSYGAYMFDKLGNRVWSGYKSLQRF